MTLARIMALTMTLVISSSLMAQEAKPEKKPADKPKAKGMNIVGSYSFTGGKKAGEDASKEMLQGKCMITKKMITLEGQGMTFEIAYTADMMAKPATIDMEITKPEEFASKAKGIIKIEKDVVTLCYDPTGEERPKEFASTKDNGYNIFMMKKAPKVKKEDK